MAAPVRCVFLDLGKVLLDYDFSKFLRRMKSLATVDEDRLRRVFTSKDLAHRFETGRMSESQFHREICNGLAVEIPPEDFIEAWNTIFLENTLVQDSLLSALAKRVPLWALSNTNPIHFRYIEAHFPILRHFEGFILSFRARSRKPEEAIFTHALEEAQVEATGALFVDDQLPNVEAAQRMGFDAVQFTGEDQLRGELIGRALL
jgi:putative hydrolase of the HAD superfamily